MLQVNCVTVVPDALHINTSLYLQMIYDMYDL